MTLQNPKGAEKNSTQPNIKIISQHVNPTHRPKNNVDHFYNRMTYHSKIRYT